MLVHWIWFATRPGISDRVKALLVQRLYDPEDLYCKSPQELEAIEGLTPQGREALADHDLAPAEKILNQCSRLGIHVITYRDAAYPKRLQNIPDPPVVLYYKGGLPDFEGLPLIGVVGTRHPTLYGMTMAKRMGYQIAACGGIVVSGMAFGIDALAMSGALTAGQPVIGVLGCGVDVIYPASNRALFQDAEKHGCLLSEFPPGTPPIARNFPRRNRIISGLCCGVLVVEAPEKSGALITAQLAADQNRDVFVLPVNVDCTGCEGNLNLLREGATPVRNGWDVVGEYKDLFPGKVHAIDTGTRQTAYPDELRRLQRDQKPSRVAEQKRAPAKKNPPKKAKTLDKPRPEPYSDVRKPKPALSAQEQTVVDALGDGEVLVDDVIASCGLPTAAVLSALTMLEVKGVVKRLPGKRVCKNIDK